MIENSRNPRFIMLDATNSDVKNFEVALIKNKEIQKIEIGRVVKISYYGNEQIKVFHSYTGQPRIIFLD